MFGVDGIVTLELGLVEDDVLLEVELDPLADGEAELNNELNSSLP